MVRSFKNNRNTESMVKERGDKIKVDGWNNEVGLYLFYLNSQLKG